MTPDWLLLRRYAQENSQEAFAALTARYLNLVYAVCLREVHDPELAQDTTQAVFLLLARAAPTFRSKTALPSWLFRTARFTSQNARTREQRRRRYEEKAAMELAPPAAADEHWSELEPLLNQSLAALGESDRNCVLLRFFQGLSFAEVGESLGLSEEAARKRVTRSLDKMRRFFTKEGAVVSGAALAVLLTAHAAKAAPSASAAGIAGLTRGLLAGHTAAASHVYQLSEGALKAMKFAQIKVAVGVTTALTVGLTTYAVARNIAPAAVTGHLLQQASGQTLTAVQVAERCRAAYAALQTYQVTSTVTQHSVFSATGKAEDEQTSAVIQFARPGKFHVEGADSDKNPFAYLSDGSTTVQKNLSTSGWEKVVRVPSTTSGIEMAIGTITGVSADAGTTIPALLLDTDPSAGSTGWGVPAALGKGVVSSLEEPSNPNANHFRWDVTEGDVNGQSCYVLTPHAPSFASAEVLWIDKKTFLLRRSVSDSDTPAQTFIVAGTSHAIPALKTHKEENFTNERVNEPLPGSTFTLPAAG